MSPYSRYLVFLLPLAVLGCSLLSPPTQEEVVKQALPPSTQIPQQWQAEKSSVPPLAIEEGWLKRLNDPLLDKIVAEALANNPDYRQAAVRVEIAQQKAVIAGAQLMPQIGAQFADVHSKDQDHDTSQGSQAFLGVSWEIDVWGRLRAKRAASEASAQAASLDYASARLSLVAMTARLWYLNTEATQLLALSEQAVQVYSEILHLVESRRSFGKVSDLDVADARANVATAKAALEELRASQAQLKRGLEVLLGRYPAAELATQSVYPPLPPSEGAGVPSSVLERRPDLKSAEYRVLEAFRMQESAQLSLLPSFSISLALGHLDDSLLSKLNLKPWLANIGIGAFVPIYEGGALRAQVAIATALQAGEVNHYGTVVLGAFKEIENALANEQYLAQRQTYYDSAVQSRRQAVDIALAKYRAGRIDSLWVANLQMQKLNAESSAIKLHGARRTNRIQLYLALGIPYNEQAGK